MITWLVVNTLVIFGYFRKASGELRSASKHLGLLVNKVFFLQETLLVLQVKLPLGFLIWKTSLNRRSTGAEQSISSSSVHWCKLDSEKDNRVKEGDWGDESERLPLVVVVESLVFPFSPVKLQNELLLWKQLWVPPLYLLLVIASELD